MSQSPHDSASPTDDGGDHTPASEKSPQAQLEELGPANRVQWFGRPDEGEEPLGFWRLVVITLSGHIGVRPRAKRHEDFRRANGLHVFIAAIVYFALVIGVLIMLVNFVSQR